MRHAVLVIAMLALGAGTAAGRDLELRVDAQREIIEARLVGEPRREPLFLRDLDKQRRVPAFEVTVDGGGLVARFDLRILAPDGHTHQLALDWGDTELARGSAVLPAPAPPSSLRWLVIVGPLIGLVMIGTAIWIGRRVVIKRRAIAP